MADIVAQRPSMTVADLEALLGDEDGFVDYMAANPVTVIRDDNGPVLVLTSPEIAEQLSAVQAQLCEPSDEASTPV